MMRQNRFIRAICAGLFIPICLVLIAQIFAQRVLAIQENTLRLPGLRNVPMTLASWQAKDEETLDASVNEYLRPDEYILRTYQSPTDASVVTLFVAYFKSLQTDYGPHSPSVCLPGAGWLVLSSKIASVEVSRSHPAIPVNEYVMEKDGKRIVVFYWYQNDRDIWAQEFHAKLRLLPDLLKYRRADVSLVRLVAPVQMSTGEQEIANCVRFTKAVFPELAERFGSAK